MFVSDRGRFLTRSADSGKNLPVPRHKQVMTLQKSHDVQAWRRSRLFEAGFPVVLADRVAADPGFDLHALLQLVDQGCPPELAVRIVAPLAREVAP